MNEIKNFLDTKRPLSRLHFFIAGLILISTKFGLDSLLSSFYSRTWSPADYLIRDSTFHIEGITDSELSYYLAMILLAVPFIYIGTILVLRRLLDAKLPAWLVLLFFIPGMNFALFGAISLVPGTLSEQPTPNKDGSNTNQAPPTISTPAIPLSFLISRLLLVAAIGWVTVLVSAVALGAYGWGIFVGMPFFIGYLTVHLIVARYTLTVRSGIIYSLYAQLLLALALLVSFEGLVCIIMVLPLAIILGGLGATARLSLNKRAQAARGSLLILWVILPNLIYWDANHSQPTQVYAVTSSLEIKAPPEKVWQSVIAFPRLPDPSRFLFKAGIAYPVSADIVGQGVDAVRYCRFNTGSFTEPITVWQEPHILRFGVTQQPDPMVELSPYPNLRPAHLDGYFRTTQGEFRLTQKVSSTGSTIAELTGTTWYSVDYWPQFYWRLWTNEILHAIHLRVLEHIKKLAENTALSFHDGSNSLEGQ